MLGADQRFQIGDALGGNLRKHRGEDSTPEHDCDGRRRVGDVEKLQQLVGDALARQRHEVIRATGAGFERRTVGLAAPEAGVEAEIAKDAQVILGNALERIADEAHVALPQIVEPAEIVEYLAGPGIGGQRVDGEVAPRGVLLPRGGEGDRGAAAVGGDVPAQRGHLVGVTVADGGDGPVIDARRHGLDSDLVEALDYLFRLEAGGEIDVADRKVEEVVPHRASNIARGALIGIESLQQPRHSTAAAPFGGVDSQVHWSLRERLTIIAAVAPQILRPFQTIW